MEREFEEVGLSIDDQPTGLFSGTAEWDDEGTLERLKLLKPSGHYVIIDRDKLWSQRTKIEYGHSNHGPIANLLHWHKSFLLSWTVFWGLEASLEKLYAEDLAEARSEGRFHKEFDANARDEASA